MSDLVQILNAIRKLSPADLRKLQSYLEAALFTHRTLA